jgi:hypothetical protein
MTAVGFEPTPLRNGASSHRLRPLGKTVLTVSNGWAASSNECVMHLLSYTCCMSVNLEVH